MKRFLSIMLTAILALSLFAAFPIAAFADDDVSMSVSLLSDSVSSSGEVKIRVNIKNSGSDISNATLTIDGDTLDTFSSISGGDSKSNTYTYSVSPSQLGSKTTVRLDYECDGSEGSTTTSVRLPSSSGSDSESSSKPSASASASASAAASAGSSSGVKVQKVVKVDKESAPYNSEVNFTFVIENQGDVAISNVKITASALNSGNPVAEEFSLEPGKAKMVTYTGTIVQDIEVTPRLTYTANGKTYEESFGDTISVRVSNADVSVSINPSKTIAQQGETISFAVTITNSGKEQISNIKLFSSDDQSIAIGTTSLAAGESMNETVSQKITQSGPVSFYVTAQDASGSTYTFNSNSVDISVSNASANPLATSEYADQLSIDVQPSSTELDSEGIVTFTITLTNTSQATFSDVVVSESSIGNIDTIAVMEPGTATITKEVTVSETTDFNFIVTANDITGQTISLSADPVKITVSGGSEVRTLGVLLYAIVGVIIAIIIVAIILIILVRKDKKKKRQREQKNARTVRKNTASGGSAAHNNQEKKAAVGAQRAKQPKHGSAPKFDDRYKL